MAVRVRLTRVGSRKNAMWRVVVADQRSPRDGRFIEMIGHYNPQTEPSQIVIDRERLDHWIQLGARPSQTVQKLMRAENSQPATAAAPPAAPDEEVPGATEPEVPETEDGAAAEASGAEAEGGAEAEAGDAASDEESG